MIATVDLSINPKFDKILVTAYYLAIILTIMSVIATEKIVPAILSCRLERAGSSNY